jgi:hypothetical protein
MTWAEHHRKSELLAFQADDAARLGMEEEAAVLYVAAAEAEVAALNDLSLDKLRTIGITTVSACALWKQAREYFKAQLVAYKGLSLDYLPQFARDQLMELLQVIETESNREKVGIRLSEDEVMVSLRGGLVGYGTAPFDLVQRKVSEIINYLFRVVEWLDKRPYRPHGPAPEEIARNFQPYLVQKPAGSYQFAVRVSIPLQPDLFTGEPIPTKDVTGSFLKLVQAALAEPEREFEKLVQDEDYRYAFMALSKNLAPSGKVYSELELSGMDDTRVSVVLQKRHRDELETVIRKTRQAKQKKKVKEFESIRGVLRGLSLNQRWLEVNVDGAEKPVQIHKTSEALDDIIGPLVNSRVIVYYEKSGKSGKRSYRDISADEG